MCLLKKCRNSNQFNNLYDPIKGYSSIFTVLAGNSSHFPKYFKVGIYNKNNDIYREMECQSETHIDGLIKFIDCMRYNNAVLPDDTRYYVCTSPDDDEFTYTMHTGVKTALAIAHFKLPKQRSTLIFQDSELCEHELLSK